MVFDEGSETCTLMAKEEWSPLGQSPGTLPEVEERNGGS